MDDDTVTLLLSQFVIKDSQSGGALFNSTNVLFSQLIFLTQIEHHAIHPYLQWFLREIIM